VTTGLLFALKIAVASCILAIGMDASPGDARFLLQRPRLLGRSLLAMYVLVPVVAVCLVAATTLSPALDAALLVLAVSAGAPLLPRKLLGSGDGAYGFSLVLLTSLLAIGLVPAWLWLLAAHFANPPGLGPARVAAILAKSFFIPLAVGMLLRWLFKDFAGRTASPLLAAGGLVLTLCALVLLGLHWQVVLEAGWQGAAALLVLVALALLIGHLLGGPVEQERTTLAMACASRHVGVAVTVAASLPGPRTAVLVATYVLASAVISLPYLRWRRAGG
jgi:bile acid:Na+ symporter, BASS family